MCLFLGRSLRFGGFTLSPILARNSAIVLKDNQSSAVARAAATHEGVNNRSILLLVFVPVPIRGLGIGRWRGPGRRNYSPASFCGLIGHSPQG